MNIQHKSLANGRWAKMTFAEQMANIGSEVSRAIKWKNKNKIEYSHKSINRAHELLWLTIESVTIKSHLRELTRTREAINDYFYGDNEYGTTDMIWENYFNHFNIKARSNIK